MDNNRFDSLTKQFATGASRRGILKGIFGGAAAVVAGGATRRSASALHQPTNQCRHLGNNCFPNEDASHQCCASENLVCNNATAGQCVCQPHFFDCGGRCIHESHCCPTGGGATCPAGTTCIDNTCQCIPNGSSGNPNHPELCCSGCVCPDGNCCAASHCEEPQCIPNGDPGNVNHPDLCCSGCVCPDGNCCNASHCEEPTNGCTDAESPKRCPKKGGEEYTCKRCAEETKGSLQVECKAGDPVCVCRSRRCKVGDQRFDKGDEIPETTCEPQLCSA